MIRNVPVISSDHESLKEILGDSAYFFDAKNPEKISDAILKIASDEQLKNKLRALGIKQAKKYSWFKMAAETLEIYYKIKK